MHSGTAAGSLLLLPVPTRHAARLPATLLTAPPWPPAPCLAPALQEIKAKINALQQAVMKIGESLSGKTSEGGENVQDAEVKDKDK